MGNHDTGRDRSQEGRTGRKGHVTNGIKGSRGGNRWSQLFKHGGAQK